MRLDDRRPDDLLLLIQLVRSTIVDAPEESEKTLYALLNGGSKFSKLNDVIIDCFLRDKKPTTHSLREMVNKAAERRKLFR